MSYHDKFNQAIYNAQMAELRRQLADSQRQKAEIERERAVVRAESEILIAEIEARLKSAADYIKPAMKIAVSPPILPMVANIAVVTIQSGWDLSVVKREELEDVEPKRNEEELALQNDTGRHSFGPVRQNPSPVRHISGPGLDSSPACFQIFEDADAGRHTLSPV